MQTHAVLVNVIKISLRVGPVMVRALLNIMVALHDRTSVALHHRGLVADVIGSRELYLGDQVVLNITSHLNTSIYNIIIIELQHHVVTVLLRQQDTGDKK